MFYGALFAQLLVAALHWANVEGVLDLGYLWYNLIGACAVLLIAVLTPKKAGL